MRGIDQFPDFVTGLTEAGLPFPGAQGWFMQGDGRQVAFIQFHEAVEVPEHSHKEQWELVLAGSVRLRVGGEAKEYHAGDNFFIPSGVPHSALVRAGYKAAIFFNEPDRYAAAGQ
jgi:mannose-6-phosphate isomerase-like protein (cupin superfamily)